jgi:hypothetical protein
MPPKHRESEGKGAEKGPEAGVIRRLTIRRALAVACFLLAALIALGAIYVSVSIDEEWGFRFLKGFAFPVDLGGAFLAYLVILGGERLWRRLRVDPAVFD